MTAKPFAGISPTDYLASAYLAWDSIGGDRNRNRWLALLALLITLSLSVVMTRVEVPKVDRALAEKVPERLAKLVMAKKLEPPPAPPPKEEVAEEKKPEEAKPDEPEPPADVAVAKAKEKAQKAFSEAKQELAAMQDLASAFDMGEQQLSKGGAAAFGAGGNGAVSRDMITSRAGKGSGGVTMGTASSGGGGYGVAGGAKLATAQMAKVASSITESSIGATRKNASGNLERTQEEIRRMMDRSNGALQAIYQRALRSNPTLKGQIVLRLVIAADGSVTTADLVSSDLHDPEIEKKLLTRIKAINFGAIEGVAVWNDTYTLNFFPS